MNKSNQWELNGDCSICRRKSYCSKPCTKWKRETEAEIKSLTKNVMNKATGGVMEKYINEALYYL